MNSLRELQREFSSALRASAADLIPASLSAPAPGFAVYRNNLREGAHKALLADYPVIARLVGADCMRQLAVDYVAGHPSRAGDLSEFGRYFAAFLDQRYGSTAHDYLADVARLERAIDECLNLPQPPALSVATLADLDPEKSGARGFALQPAVRLIASSYPVHRIWTANQGEAVTDEVIDLGRGGECILVQRNGEEVLVRRIDPGMHAFIASLIAGDALENALAVALTREPTFDPGRALFDLFSWQLVCGIRAAVLN